MNIREYWAADEELAINLWNKCLPADQIDKHNFYKRIVYDVNFDPANYLLAFVDDVPLGFMYCTRRTVPDEIGGMEPDKGWIVAMGVHPDCRRQGVGGALVKAAEEKLSAAGVKYTDLGTYPANYFFPGVDKGEYGDGVHFFESMGYVTRGECCSMDIHLHGYRYPEKYKEKKRAAEFLGYRIKPYEDADALPLFRFMRDSFPHWLPNARDCMRSGKAGERIILAKDKAGDVAGFVMRAMDDTEERFGPFGVKQDLQGLGLGSILFHEMMLDMARRRIFYTYFLWTGGRNLDIYASWGMKVYRTYNLMGKPI